MYTKPYITNLTTCQDKNACSHQIVEPLKWSLEYFYFYFILGRACLLLFACVFALFLSLCIQLLLFFVSLLLYFCWCIVIILLLPIQCSSVREYQQQNRHRHILTVNCAVLFFDWNLFRISNSVMNARVFRSKWTGRVTEIEIERLIHGCIICVKRTFHAILL